MKPRRVVLDTNVFVAAGFNPRSASARLVEAVRTGRLRMVWHPDTRGETEHVLGKIPPLSWDRGAPLFREEDRFDAPLDVAPFGYVADEADRKFAALAAAAGAVLVTMDEHLLGTRAEGTVAVTTPGAFRRGEGR